MRARTVLPALLLVAGLVGLAALPAGADSPDTKKIDKLIEQLGSDSSEERQKASQVLDAIGAPALEALRKASKSSDAEVRKRATDLVGRIEKRTVSDRLLAAKKVHLVFKDTPLEKAIAEIARQSGYTVKLHDPDGKRKGKKITLDTGKTTFWDALGQFCDKADLVDADPNQMNVPAMPGRFPVPAGIAPGALPPPGKAAPPPPAGGAKKEEAKVAPAPAAAVALVALQRPGGFPAPPIAGPMGAAWVPVAPGEIYLLPGKAAQKAADTSTAVRIRPADGKRQAALPADKEHLGLVLEISPEPALRWQRTIAVKVDKAVDDQDQKLSAVDVSAGPNLPAAGIGRVIVGGPGMARIPLPMAGWGFGGFSGLYHYAPVKLKKGDKQTTSLKELSGTITAAVLDRAEPMLVADKLLKSAGKTFKGQKGGSIKINKASKDDNGVITLEFEVEMPADVVPETQVNIPIPAGALPAAPGIAPPPAAAPPGAGPAGKLNPLVEDKAPAAPAKPPVPALQPGGGPLPPPLVLGGMTRQTFAPNGLTLQDDKGKPLFAQIRVNWTRGRFAPGGPGQPKMEYVATYRPLKDLPAEPAKLVFTARRAVEVTIPFTLKDVKVK